MTQNMAPDLNSSPVQRSSHHCESLLLNAAPAWKTGSMVEARMMPDTCVGGRHRRNTYTCPGVSSLFLRVSSPRMRVESRNRSFSFYATCAGLASTPCVHTTCRTPQLVCAYACRLSPTEAAPPSRLGGGKGTEKAAITHRQPAPTGQHLPCNEILAGPLCDHEQDHHVQDDGDRISSLGVPASKQRGLLTQLIGMVVARAGWVYT